GGGHPGRGLAHAEADLQDDGTVVAEELREIEEAAAVDVEAPPGPQALQGVRLPGRHPAAARLEAADPPLEVRPGGVGLGTVREAWFALGAGVPDRHPGAVRGVLTGGGPGCFGGVHGVRHSAVESTADPAGTGSPG